MGVGRPVTVPGITTLSLGTQDGLLSSSASRSLERGLLLRFIICQ